MGKTAADAFKSRIVGQGEEAPDSLLAHPLNWRAHPKHQVDALEGMLDQVGWVQRVIVNQRTGHIVDGHLRVQVAMRRGEPSVPVLYVELSDAEERLVLAVLDPISGLAGTDQELLDQVLQGLDAENDALAAMLDELRSDGAAAIEEAGAVDDDEVPELQEAPVTSRGEVWVLGRHRLMVGDSAAPADVETLMGEDRADLVWIDPPYNVAIESADGKRIMNDDMDAASFRRLLGDWMRCAFMVTKDGGPIYIAHADSAGLDFRAAMIDAGWLLKQTIVWVKDSFTLGRQDYQWQHEPILYGWKPGAAHCWYGDRDKTTVHQHPKPKKADLHPTMKPVELVKHQVQNSSRRGDVVLDLFGGSGTTLIACEALGRRARLMELDPIYADVIIRRWQAWTNATAYRMTDAASFEQVATATEAA